MSVEASEGTKAPSFMCNETGVKSPMEMNKKCKLHESVFFVVVWEIALPETNISTRVVGKMRVPFSIRVGYVCSVEIMF